ncbi:MAG TPA: NAD(P)/FAD-dependent oxidoreductase [Terriglobales bacterium]
MQDTDSIAVIGGGPAGALAASRLAAAGAKVLLFDEKLAWEKPCGGGITHKALTHFPFLAEAHDDRNRVHRCRLTSPAGKQAMFELHQPVAVFSRRVLNGLILERAQQAGAKIRKEHVFSIDGTAGNWKIQTTGGEHNASFVIIAAGARGQLRNHFAKPFSAHDLMMTAGYFIPGAGDRMEIEFVRGLHGYIWIFPRIDHFSAGICGKLSDGATHKLKKILDESLAKSGLATAGAQFYAHVLPSLRARTLRSSPFCGDGWAMIGDTAGFVDPITGEGLYYALRSAELLGDALLAAKPASYAERARQDFLPELELAAAMSTRFFTGTWRSRPIIDRMIDLTASSPTFQALMRDLFSGVQGYLDLRRRLFLALPKMLAESLANALQSNKNDVEEQSAATEAA